MLVALGLAIIFGLMNVINMAHGEFVTIGAFTLAFVQRSGGSFWLALALAPLVGAAAGYLLERLVVQHLYRRPLDTILATWGISLALQQILQIVFGATPQYDAAPVEGSLVFAGMSYPAYRLILIAFAFAVFAGGISRIRPYALRSRPAHRDRESRHGRSARRRHAAHLCAGVCGGCGAGGVRGRADRAVDQRAGADGRQLSGALVLRRYRRRRRQYRWCGCGQRSRRRPGNVAQLS